MAGKGDRPRPVNGDKYRANWSDIFTPKEYRAIYDAYIKPRLNSDTESTHHENKQPTTTPKANVENERQ